MNFIKCSISSINDGDRYNDPVNLDLITSFEKRVANNGSKPEYFVIKFCGNYSINWFFESEEDRDNEYESIVDIVNILTQEIYK